MSSIFSCWQRRCFVDGCVPICVFVCVCVPICVFVCVCVAICVCVSVRARFICVRVPFVSVTGPLTFSPKKIGKYSPIFHSAHVLYEIHRVPKPVRRLSV
jgi:hypothetical protein